MYYDRTISNGFSELIEPKGQLRWLFDFVKINNDLDFLIGKNNGNEWISIYRGLSRIVKIKKYKRENKINIDGDKAYKELLPDLYQKKDISVNFSQELNHLYKKIPDYKKLNQYYNNKKEGYYQNEISRLFGINSNPNSDFIIFDKEAVLGFTDKSEKEEIFGPFHSKYQNYLNKLSHKNPQIYGKNLGKKSIGGELDFFGLDKEGNLLLIELKHGSYPSGIYLSPLQIGMYFDLFSQMPLEELKKSVKSMINQKKKIGLIHPEWEIPQINKLVPMLVIAGYNERSSARIRFKEVLSFCRSIIRDDFLEDLIICKYDTESGFTSLEWN